MAAERRTKDERRALPEGAIILCSAAEHSQPAQVARSVARVQYKKPQLHEMSSTSLWSIDDAEMSADVTLGVQCACSSDCPEMSAARAAACCVRVTSTDDQRPAAASARMFKGSHQSSRGAVNWPAGRNVNVAFAALLLGRSVGKVQVNIDFYSTSQMFRIIGVQTVSQHPPKTHAMHALQKKRDVNEKLPLLVVIIIIVIIIICQHLIHSWRCNSTWLILC